MHAHQHGFGRGDVALDQGQMGAGLAVALVGVDREVTVQAGQVGLGIAFDGHLAATHAVADEVAHGGDLQAVLGGKDFQVGHAGHGAVVLHDLADDGGGLETGQTGQVHAAFGLAGAGQHAVGTGAQGEDVTGGHQVVGTGAVGHGGLDGGGAVGGGDAGGDAFAGLDGHREVGAETRAVMFGHQGQLQLVGHFAGHGQADETTAELGHEIDGFRGHEFGGHGQVAFVFPVLIVHKNDHFALPDLGNGFFSAAQRHVNSLACAVRDGVIFVCA